MGKGGAISESVPKEILLSYTYVAIWIFLSFIVIVYNKFILDNRLYNWPFPIFLTMIHMPFCAALAFTVTKVFKLVEPVSMSKELYLSSVGKKSSARMAATVTGMDAKPAGSRRCRFELKEWKTVFTCQVCKVDGYDTKRYHCNHCGEDRHEGCIRLANQIKVGPGPNNIFSTNPEFTLFHEPQQGSNSKNKKWAKDCLVCGMPIMLYSYYARTTENKDLNMHPCCAELTRLGSRIPRDHELQTSEKENCLVCGKKRPGGSSPDGPTNFYCWSYKLAGGKYRIHVHCYREMVIQAWKNKRHYDDDNNKIRIVLKRRGDNTRNEWEGILKGLVQVALEASGMGPTQILLHWLDLF